MSISKTLIIAVLASTGVAASAFANDTSKVTRQIQINDLNLTSEAGIETLNRRIERATREACARSWDRSDRRSGTREDRTRCIAEVRGQIQDQLAGVVSAELINDQTVTG